jgi:hypothetical protein
MIKKHLVVSAITSIRTAAFQLKHLLELLPECLLSTEQGATNKRYVRKN